MKRYWLSCCCKNQCRLIKQCHMQQLRSFTAYVKSLIMKRKSKCFSQLMKHFSDNVRSRGIRRFQMRIMAGSLGTENRCAAGCSVQADWHPGAQPSISLAFWNQIIMLITQWMEPKRTCIESISNIILSACRTKAFLRCIQTIRNGMKRKGTE